jgi:hypothetical protein
VRFRPTSGHFPDDGGAVTAEARFRVGGFRLHAYATRTRVVVELRGLEHDLSGFALGDVYPGIANGRAWLAEGDHAALAADLRLGPGDYVRVRRNCLWASVAPARATGGFVPALAAFAAALPPVPRERASVDVAALPPALRPLARYFGGWTEGDDEARSAYQRRAGPRRRAKLLAAVGPQVGEIDEYLTGLGDAPWPDAALHLQRLAEVAAELRVAEV